MTTAQRLTTTQLILLLLRVTMETGIVTALAYWGAHSASTTPAKAAYGIGAPAIGFGIWGTVDFHNAGRHSEQLRLIEELAISLAAAAALYTADQPAAGIGLAVLSLAYHALVYATGATLLEHQPEPAK
jgi:hypothetical protein